MKTILQQLYDGNLCPVEHFRPKIEEYQALQRKHYRRYKKFNKKLKKLSPTLHEQFVMVIEEQLTEISSETYDAFIDGFKLGAKMMMEVLENDSSNQK